MKLKFYRPCVQNPASAWPSNLPYIGKKTMTSQFTDMNSPSIFFHVDVFLLSSLVTGSSCISLSQLVLEWWQFLFIKDWPEIRKSKIPQSEFCPISRGWSELGIPNLARMSLIKSYWILQNARVTAFTISELLRENQKGGWKGGITSSPPRLGLNLLM